MKAYMNGITKEQFVAETKRHQKLDHFVRGTYGKSYSDQACAVGCAIKSINRLKGTDLDLDDHAGYGTQLGIPEWLTRLEDTIFEGVSDERSETWPVEFAEAINTGSNLDNIKTTFVIYILEQNIEVQKSQLGKYDELDIIINDVIEANNLAIQAQILNTPAARSTAKSAAWSAAKSAAWSAAWSAAKSAAWSAAKSAASAAWSAAWSAESAAKSAAESAESAAESAASAAWSAESAAWSAAFEKYADKLLELMKNECKS